MEVHREGKCTAHHSSRGDVVRTLPRLLSPTAKLIPGRTECGHSLTLGNTTHKHLADSPEARASDLHLIDEVLVSFHQLRILVVRLAREAATLLPAPNRSIAALRLSNCMGRSEIMQVSPEGMKHFNARDLNCLKEVVLQGSHLSPAVGRKSARQCSFPAIQQSGCFKSQGYQRLSPLEATSGEEKPPDSGPRCSTRPLASVTRFPFPKALALGLAAQTRELKGCADSELRPGSDSPRSWELLSPAPLDAGLEIRLTGREKQVQSPPVCPNIGTVKQDPSVASSNHKPALRTQAPLDLDCPLDLRLSAQVCVPRQQSSLRSLVWHFRASLRGPTESKFSRLATDWILSPKLSIRCLSLCIS